MNDTQPHGALSQSGFSPGVFRRTLPSLTFYSGVANIVVKASSEAKKGRFDDAAWRKASDDIFAVLRRHGPPISIQNVDVLARTPGPVLIVGNHMSTLETFLLPGLVLPYKRMTFVVKKSLVDYPVFGPIMRASDPIVVGRDNPREDLRAMLDGGKNAIQSGRSLVIFPQTTRMPQFHREQFNSIGAKLAKRTGVPIIPLALQTDFWSNGKLIKDFGPINRTHAVHLTFGEPIYVESGPGGVEPGPGVEVVSEREAHKQVADFIEAHLADWAKE